MKKLFAFLTAFIFFVMPVFAVNEQTDKPPYDIQAKIDSIGFKILNANELNKRVVFPYNKKYSKKLFAPETFKRQIVMTDEDLAHTDSDDEIAAIISRKLIYAMKSYTGAPFGYRGSFEAAFSPKKYELIADKIAVEYMVKAGYNPLGLITYINKTCPQKRQDTISRSNLTSKRLMYIYENIYLNYPYFLAYNKEYIKNDYYQNFLLNSVENRRIFESALKMNDYTGIQYE